MFGINPFELMIILMVGLIVVGPKRLPEIGRTVGRAFHELRRVQEEIRDTVRFDLDDDDDDPEPPSFPARRERVPDEPQAPTAVELASAAARERDALDAAPEAPELDPAEAEPELEVPDRPRSEAPEDDGAPAPGSNGSARRPARDEAG